MSERTIRSQMQWLYRNGMKEHEIAQRLKTSMIWTRHALARLIERDAQLQADHLRARRVKGRRCLAQIIMDDPVCEQEDRYSAISLERLSCAGANEAWNK